jgi:hypothetical protein
MSNEMSEQEINAWALLTAALTNIYKINPQDLHTDFEYYKILIRDVDDDSETE